MSGMAQTPASGILFALSAGILWGFVPVYINFFGNVDPLEIVAHRSLWSLVMLFGIVMWRRQISMALKVFVNKKQLFSFIITACFLSANWTVYVYAVQSGHVASAALGYFIYPIFTVLLGIIMLRERLGRWAWLANLFFWRRCNACFSGDNYWCANGGTLDTISPRQSVIKHNDGQFAFL